MRLFKLRLRPVNATFAVSRRHIQTGMGTPPSCGVRYHWSHETPANAIEAPTTFGRDEPGSRATVRRAARSGGTTPSRSTERCHSVATVPSRLTGSTSRRVVPARSAIRRTPLRSWYALRQNLSPFNPRVEALELLARMATSRVASRSMWCALLPADSAGIDAGAPAQLHCFPKSVVRHRDGVNRTVTAVDSDSAVASAYMSPSSLPR